MQSGSLPRNVHVVEFNIFNVVNFVLLYRTEIIVLLVSFNAWVRQKSPLLLTYNYLSMLEFKLVLDIDVLEAMGQMLHTATGHYLN